MRRGREQFLKIYQDRPAGEAGQDEEEEVKEIRFKRETAAAVDLESGGQLIRLKAG